MIYDTKIKFVGESRTEKHGSSERKGVMQNVCMFKTWFMDSSRRGKQEDKRGGAILGLVWKGIVGKGDREM